MATQTGSYDFKAAKAGYDISIVNNAPNLTPMFSNHNPDGTYPDGGNGGYWQPSQDKVYNRSFFTALEDGWMHVEAASTAQKEFVPPRIGSLKANDKVTMLVEWRNASWTGSGANFYSRNYPDNVQLPANWTAPVNTASGEARHTYTVSSANGAQAWNGLINWTFTAASSSTWTGDIRISFYKGEYTGPYKPYVGELLYAIQPNAGLLTSKTYTGVNITANSDPAGWLYFGSVKPTAYNTPWRVKYVLRSRITTLADSTQYSEVTINGCKNTYYAYQTYNAVSNTTYRPIYSHLLYTLKDAGVTAGYGHLLGIRFQSAYWGSTFSATDWPREVIVEVVEAENCAVTLSDSMFLYANAPGTGATNYNARTAFDGTTQGFSESGDRNTYDRVLYNSNVKAAANLTAARIVCGNSAGYKNIGAGTVFDITYPLLYNNTAYNSGAVRADLDLVRINIAFSNNGTIENAAQHTVVYLKGTIIGNAFTIAASPFMTCKVPTSADGYCYLPLGRLRDSTTNGQFTSSHELWCYKDGAFGPVSLREASQAAKTATNYITKQGSGDTWIHAQDMGPDSSNNPTSTTRGWRIGDALDLFRGTVSMFKAWVDGTVAKVRVGIESAGHSVFSPSGMEVFTDASTSVASFGASARIGKQNLSRMEIENDFISVYDKTNTRLLAMGHWNVDGSTITQSDDSSYVTRAGIVFNSTSAEKKPSMVGGDGYLSAHVGTSFNYGDLSLGSDYAELSVSTRHSSAAIADPKSWIMLSTSSAELESRGTVTITSNYNSFTFGTDGKLTVPGALDLGSALKIVDGGTGMTGVTSGSSGVVTAASGTTVTAQSYVKWGKVCQVYVAFKRSSAVSVPASGNIDDILVFTLNEGYRPKIYSSGRSNGDGAGAAWYTVGTDGKVNLGALEGQGTAYTRAAGTALNFFATYILP